MAKQQNNEPTKTTTTPETPLTVLDVCVVGL